MAADWHELMIPWRGMQPSTARDSGQVDPRRGTIDTPPPQSAALGLHPVARRLLLINRPRRDDRLSRRRIVEYISPAIMLRCCDNLKSLLSRKTACRRSGYLAAHLFVHSPIRSCKQMENRESNIKQDLFAKRSR